MLNENIFATYDPASHRGWDIGSTRSMCYTMQFFLHLSVIIIIFIHVAETQKSEMVLICPYYKTKKLYEKWVGGVTLMHQMLFNFFF